MKTVLSFVFFLSFSFASFSQGAASYSYNFGTNATNSKSTKSKQTNFFSGATNSLATPTNGGIYQVNFHSDPPNTALVGLITSSGPSTITSTSVPYFPSDFGSGTRMYLRGEPGNNSDPISSNSLSIYNISGANTSISVAFDFYINKAGTNAANQDGEIVLMVGNDDDNNNKGFQKDHMHSLTEYDKSSIFMGIKINITNGATTATTWKNDETWNSTNLTSSAWSSISSGKHRMFILANNAASASASYSFSNGTSSSVGAKKFDIYLDGVIIENDIDVVGDLASSATKLNSFRFDVGFDPNAQNITLLLDNLSYQMSANGAQAAALPVTLSSFTAKQTTDNNVSLAWVTSSESVNKGFSIERQEEGSGKFQSLGFIASKAEGGNSQTTLAYSFKDVTAKKGTNMYRLVQEDLDGKKTYSEVRVVKLNGQSVSMVFPNPSNGAVNISRTADGKKMNIQVIDQSGSTIRQVNNITDANYKLNIQKSGVYTIKMTYPETGEQSIQRIVVQK
jgi:hypothetical protein